MSDERTNLDTIATNTTILITSLADQKVWTYKGQDRKTMAGAAQTVTIPSGSLLAHIFAEVGDIRAAVNGAATATSSIYVTAGGVAAVYLGGVTSLSVYGATGAYADIIFYG